MQLFDMKDNKHVVEHLFIYLKRKDDLTRLMNCPDKVVIWEFSDDEYLDCY